MLRAPGLTRPLLAAFVAALLLAHPTTAAQLPSADAWTNVNYQKQLDLAGSVSHLVSTITLQSHASGAAAAAQSGAAQDYFFLLPADEARAVSWSRVTIKPAASSELLASGALPASRRPILPIVSHGALDDDADTYLYSVAVPAAALPSSGAAKDEAVVLTLEATFNHVTAPLPAAIKQTDSQLLLWRGDVAVRSPYKSRAARVRIKAPHPKIVSFEPSDATKAGAVLTFGPAPAAPYKPGAGATRGRVHYQHDAPVVSIVALDRTVELSHWGDAASVEDRIWMRNDGAALKGHFSRIDHQMASFYRGGAATHVLSTLSMHLPAGARDAYFTDQIGNVSTSHFRPLPPAPLPPVVPLNHLPTSKASLLELQPRYPLLGGWNYTFVVGFTLPLSRGGWLKRASNGTADYTAAVPFLTPITDLAIDEATVRIVLPEGAVATDLSLPFDADVEHTITKTYLDTRGRNTIVLRRSVNSERIGQLVYVSYRLSALEHLRKVFAVSSIALGFFVLAAIVRRVDVRIK